MNFIHQHIRTLMLISGALTCTMLYAAFNPQAALLATFGESLNGPIAEVVVRSWGVLIAGALHPPLRAAALLVAATSKFAYVALVLGFAAHTAGAALLLSIALDAALVLAFGAFLLLPYLAARGPEAGVARAAAVSTAPSTRHRR